MTTILKEQLTITNAWLRLSRVVQSAVGHTFSQFGTDAPIRRLAAKFKKEFSHDAARAVGGFGSNLSAWTIKPRRLVYEAVLEQEGWTPSDFVLAISKVMPASELPDLRVCDLTLIAALQCRKNTKDLRDIIQPFNRAEKDTDDECPRFYWYPSSSAEVAARSLYNEALGIDSHLATVRNIRLFSTVANFTLAKACRVHLQATGQGVAETRIGVEAALVAAQELDLDELRDEFLSSCDEVSSEAARSFMDERNVDPTPKRIAFLTRRAG